MSVAAAIQATGIDLGPTIALHALNRLGYGPRPADVRRVLARGLERYVDDQLNPLPDPDLDTRLRPLGTLNYPISQVLTIYNADNRSLGPLIDEFQAAKLIRSVHGLNQLQEALVDFWFNPVNVYIADGFVRFSAMSYERDAIRPHVFGRFRDLLGAVAAHPAMLFFLDNYLNRADVNQGGRRIAGINENYGRELLELHTVGVDAGYSQTDVYDAARVFTGWGIDNINTSGNFIFRAAQHDRGAKHVFGLDIAAGGGQEEGHRLLDHLAAHPATARFVSWRLAQRFVSDDPPARVVDRMAATFQSTGGDLRAVMRSMLQTAEFWAEAFAGGKVKTPFEYVASVIRAVEGQVTNVRGVAGQLNNMGMGLYLSVPPTGYSNRGSEWLNPSSHLARMNFALDIAANAIPGVAVDSRSVISRLGGNPDDPRSAASTLNADLFARNLTRETLDSAGRVAPGGAVGVAPRVAGLCLASPEMQVR